MAHVDPSISRSPIADNATDLPTCCVLCSHNCGLRVDVSDGKMVAVRADKDSPMSGGYVCNKAFSIPNYAHHTQRVQHPMRRRPDGSFERITWDEAITDIAGRLRAIRDRHSGRAIGLVGVGGQGNHMDAAFALSFLDAIGSKRWFNAFAQEKTQHSLLDQWMLQATPAAMLHPDEEHTQYMLVLGTNPRVTNRGRNATDTFKALYKDETKTVVIVDPRETESTRGADLHLRVRPGRDYMLLLGLAASIVQRDLVDRELLAQRVNGYDALRDALAAVDVDRMAEGSGVSAAHIHQVAEAFASAERASIMYDLGIEQVPFSTLNSYLIRAILVITGNVGTRGGNMFIQSINPPDPKRVEQAETERALVSGIQAIRAMGSYGMFSPSLLPEEVLTDHPERLRALVVEGANPMLSFSDTEKWRQALEALELVVVIDPAMTETARLAHYVLPTPVGYEKWEFSGFPNHFPDICAQIRPPVIAGPAEALPEPEIYARIVEAMGLMTLPHPLRLLARAGGRPGGRAALFTASAVLAAVHSRFGGGLQSRLVFWLYRTIGPHFDSPALAAVWLLCFKNAATRRDAVLRTLGSKWRRRGPFAIAEELFRRVMAHPEGVEIARLDPDRNLDDHLGTRDGRIRLSPTPMIEEIARALATTTRGDSAYPMMLSAGVRTLWTANTIHRDPAWRKGKGPHCVLFISTEDAAALGVESGQAVVLETERGSAQLPARIDKRMQKGHVAVPNGFGMRDNDDVTHGVNLNELTASDDRDPFTGCPHHKNVACRVRPATAASA